MNGELITNSLLKFSNFLCSSSPPFQLSLFFPSQASLCSAKYSFPPVTSCGIGAGILLVSFSLSLALVLLVMLVPSQMLLLSVFSMLKLLPVVVFFLLLFASDLHTEAFE